MKRQKDDPDGLTPREWQVLALIREGLTNEEIAERLGISFGTAKYHVAEIISKLGADDRHDAVRKSDEKRLAKALLPFLPLTGRLGWIGTAAAMALVIAAGLVLFWGGDGAGNSEDGATLPGEIAGLDISPQILAAVEQARATTDFKHTLLLSVGEPQNVGTQGELIASLPRVSTLGELQAMLSDDVAIIVIDKSAEAEVSTDLLYELWESGRAIVGLNLCYANLPDSKQEPQAASTRGTVVTEIAPDGNTRYFDTKDVPARPDRCDWPFDIAQAGYPYLSYVPRRMELDEVAALQSRGINQFMGPGAGRLDLPRADSCYVRDTLAHLESPLEHPFNLTDCN